MNFVKGLLGNAFAWLQSVGIGALVALQQYFSSASPSSDDPVSSMVTGLILAVITKGVGALINLFPKRT